MEYNKDPNIHIAAHDDFLWHLLPKVPLLNQLGYPRFYCYFQHPLLLRKALLKQHNHSISLVLCLL